MAQIRQPSDACFLFYSSSFETKCHTEHFFLSRGRDLGEKAAPPVCVPDTNTLIQGGMCACLPRTRVLRMSHMPCCMPACTCVPALRRSTSPLLTSPDPSRMTNSSVGSDGIWEWRDNAAGFGTRIGFRHHVTAAEPGPVPKPYLGYIWWYFLPGPADSGLICRMYSIYNVGGLETRDDFSGLLLGWTLCACWTEMTRLTAHECHLESISCWSAFHQAVTAACSLAQFCIFLCFFPRPIKISEESIT